ncbi:caspase-2-like isoform X2 [Penaeus monodon]|uniref:caspase-2-like isoform X2 n=1 Tax=Penaeus monodon TaxID=6687 RepID=UPI0018A6F2AD|nr:caspase-2-like isoform X2 [Penaeus monodon]
MATMSVNTALEKGMLVEQSDGKYQCACGETLKKASLTRHLQRKTHLNEFTVQTALNKNIFVEIENGEYECACKRKLKKASLKGHLFTKIHLSEVHARKLWIKSGKNEETKDARTNNNDQREEIVVECDHNIMRCPFCGKRFSKKKYLERHAQDSTCQEEVNRKRENTKSVGEPETPIPPYSVRSDPPGHVYVFNNDFKGHEQERRGAKQDSRNLQQTFTSMGYKVFLLENLSAQQTMAEVDRIRSDPALARVDALVMVFLSHGKRALKFLAQDRATLDLRKIRRNFTNSLCPNLKGKPKIFFTNFCRGRELQIQTDGVEPTRDMVTIHAVQHGIAALRHTRDGTYFVKALCLVLQKHAADKSLRDIYLELERKTKEINGTLPQWEDDAFREFYFTQRAHLE